MLLLFLYAGICRYAQCIVCRTWQNLIRQVRHLIRLRRLNPVLTTGTSFNMGPRCLVIYNMIILHPSRISHTPNGVTVYENIWVVIKPRTNSLIWQMEYSGVPNSLIINISIFLLETSLIVYCISVNHLFVLIK